MSFDMRKGQETKKHKNFFVNMEKSIKSEKLTRHTEKNYHKKGKLNRMRFMWQTEAFRRSHGNNCFGSNIYLVTKKVVKH